MSEKYEIIIEGFTLMDYHYVITYFAPKYDARGRVRISTQKFSDEIMMEAIEKDLKDQMPALELLKVLKEKYEGQTLRI